MASTSDLYEMARKNAEVRQVAQGHAASIQYNTISEPILRLTSDLMEQLTKALDEEAVAIDIQLQILLEHYHTTTPTTSVSNVQSLFKQLQFIEQCLITPQNLLETLYWFSGEESQALFDALLTDEAVNKQYHCQQAEELKSQKRIQERTTNLVTDDIKERLLLISQINESSNEELGILIRFIMRSDVLPDGLIKTGERWYVPTVKTFKMGSIRIILTYALTNCRSSLNFILDGHIVSDATVEGWIQLLERVLLLT